MRYRFIAFSYLTIERGRGGIVKGVIILLSTNKTKGNYQIRPLGPRYASQNDMIYLPNSLTRYAQYRPTSKEYIPKN